MAAVCASSTLCSICGASSNASSNSFSASSSLAFPLRFFQFRSHGVMGNSHCNVSFLRRLPNVRKIRSLTEEETLIPGQDDEDNAVEGEAAEGEALTADQTVSVPVSPSDILTMFFQAEGTMNEAAIPTVTKALEGTEGISNLKVQVVEGIASVELKKQTTVQATGVASNLVETIQGSGFKLQTLNLSFEDEEDLR